VTQHGNTSQEVHLGPAPIDWSHAVATIPERGLERTRIATKEALEAVRAALDILACSRIQVRYRVKASAGGSYRVTGKLEADVTQACVVTTDPVSQSIRSDFDAVFHPPEALTHHEGESEDPLSDVDTEVIENGVIDVGRLVYEEIASRIDPYPRVPGSNFDWQDPAVDTPARDNPFAKLAQLKESEKGS